MNLKDVLRDSIPGLSLAIIVLPQAIAFSFLAGVPPYFGIYCAVYGVLIVAIMNPQVYYHGGPNSSMSVAIGVALLPYAPQFGADYMGYVLSLAVMVGIMQLIVAWIKPISRIMDFMSEAVVSGMIFGIGLFLILKSIAPFGGLPMNTDVYWHLIISWQTFMTVVEQGNLFAIEIGFVTLLFAILARYIPYARQVYLLVGLIAGTIYSEILNSQYGGVMITQIEQIGNINLPLVFPSYPTFSPEALPDLLSLIPAAFAIALLGLFQTIAIVRHTSRATGHYTNVRDAIKADGFSNVIAGFISALPGCGSFNRVTLMRSMLVHTRWAAVFSALWLFLFIKMAGPYAAIIPLPAMAALIMLVGANMLKLGEVAHHFKSKVETAVFIAAFVSIQVFGLLDAVLISAAIAFINWVWNKSHPVVQIQDNRVYVLGDLYYASIPVVEPYIAKTLKQHSEIELDLTESALLDPEAARWIARLGQGKDRIRVILLPKQSMEQEMLSEIAGMELSRILVREAA